MTNEISIPIKQTTITTFDYLIDMTKNKNFYSKELIGFEYVQIQVLIKWRKNLEMLTWFLLPCQTVMKNDDSSFTWIWDSNK